MTLPLHASCQYSMTEWWPTCNFFFDAPTIFKVTPVKASVKTNECKLKESNGAPVLLICIVWHTFLSGMLIAAVMLELSVIIQNNITQYY